MRDLSRFETGWIKHHVQLDENGWVASEGVLCRLGPEEFVYTAGSCDWLLWQLGQGGWDVAATGISHRPSSGPDRTPRPRSGA
ncbi:hypothetical protein [Streptomyces aurantiogriseus]|uniref:Uncharacterized protein n=1 Tax=Streptomyces aurantiogriseus TaxID=66870 RepID=A0A918CEV6_9ACTN|nr:hypothetical protein [Streptomyces aurantiogriseus]GGR19208.1 hypothetical protein GCM10010251_39240 [Streptomyces aurantiogriseus]